MDSPSDTPSRLGKAIELMLNPGSEQEGIAAYRRALAMAAKNGGKLSDYLICTENHVPKDTFDRVNEEFGVLKETLAEIDEVVGDLQSEVREKDKTIHGLLETIDSLKSNTFKEDILRNTPPQPSSCATQRANATAAPPQPKGSFFDELKKSWKSISLPSKLCFAAEMTMLPTATYFSGSPLFYLLSAFGAVRSGLALGNFLSCDLTDMIERSFKTSSAFLAVGLSITATTAFVELKDNESVSEKYMDKLIEDGRLNNPNFLVEGKQFTFCKDFREQECVAVKITNVTDKKSADGEAFTAASAELTGSRTNLMTGKVNLFNDSFDLERSKDVHGIPHVALRPNSVAKVNQVYWKESTL